MRKIIITMVLCIMMAGCAPIQNPYENFNLSQMSQVSNNDLCSIENGNYIPSDQVTNELKIRGIQECSKGELYCVNLKLSPGSSAYASCRLEYDRIEVEKKALHDAQEREDRIIRLQKEALELQKKQSIMLPSGR